MKTIPMIIMVKSFYNSNCFPENLYHSSLPSDHMEYKMLVIDKTSTTLLSLICTSIMGRYGST